MTRTGLAARNLLRRPVRAALSVLGVSVGVGALVALLSLARGFKEQVSQLFTTTGAEIVVQQAEANDPGHSALTADDLAALAAVPGVIEVCPSTFTLLSHRDQPLAVVGREPGTRLMRKYRIVEGAGLTPGRDDEALVGRTLARRDGLRVGGTLTLRDRPFRIAGHFEVASAIPIENSCVIVSFAGLRGLTKSDDRAHVAFVYLADPRQVASVSAALETARPGLRAIPTAEYVAKGMRDQLDTAEYFAWAVSAIALVVSVIVVLVVMLTNVSERTREIGTLRALGWPRRAVVGLILREGLLLCLLGVVGGIALGAAGAEAFSRSWREGIIPAHYSFALFAEAFGVGLGLGLLGAAYPAWRAAGLAPVEALRYE